MRKKEFVHPSKWRVQSLILRVGRVLYSESFWDGGTFEGLIEFSFGVASSDASRKMNVAKGSIATALRTGML